MTEYVFGVDVGGTTVKMGLFSNEGELLEKWEIPTDKREKGKNILNDIAASIESKINEKGLDRSGIAGIGMGLPGPVTDDGIVRRCVNLGWGEINAEKELSKLTGLTVKSGNDANVAALGELWQGAGAGYKSIIMITLGTGVGGGIIIDGKIVYGSHGSGGEIGHFPSADDETEPCGCGNFGCLEQYASATGVVRLAGGLLRKGRKSVLKEEGLTAKAVFDAAKEGDETALEVLDMFGERLGKALAAGAIFVDPQAFIFGGGVSNAGSIVTDTVKKYYEKYAFHSVKGTDFRLARLGSDAGIYGGAMLILGINT